MSWQNFIPLKTLNMATQIISAGTNLSKVKQTRTPKDYNSIEAGALKLELEDRVNLRNRLSLSIDGEIKEMEEKFNAAKALLNGKQ